MSVVIDRPLVLVFVKRIHNADRPRQLQDICKLSSNFFNLSLGLNEIDVEIQYCSISVVLNSETLFDNDLLVYV